MMEEETIVELNGELKYGRGNKCCDKQLRKHLPWEKRLLNQNLLEKFDGLYPGVLICNFTAIEEAHEFVWIFCTPSRCLLLTEETKSAKRQSFTP